MNDEQESWAVAAAKIGVVLVLEASGLFLFAWLFGRKHADELARIEVDELESIPVLDED